MNSPAKVTVIRPVLSSAERAEREQKLRSALAAFWIGYYRAKSKRGEERTA